MRKSLASGFGVAAALVMVFGSGTAGANPYDPFAGQKYEDVSATISNRGGTSVIATRVGEYLPTEQCIVTGARRSSGKWLLDLNCNDTYAGKSGHSGNSGATPEGQKFLELKEKAVGISANYENATAKGATPACLKDDASAKWCAGVCTKTNACSAELNEALGL